MFAKMKPQMRSYLYTSSKICVTFIRKAKLIFTVRQCHRCTFSCPMFKTLLFICILNDYLFNECALK